MGVLVIRKFVIAGTGARARVLGIPLVQQFKDEVTLVGVFDKNGERATVFAQECGGVPVFTNFAEMLAKSSADFVLITTMDSTHDEYIIQAMEAGCDVICEKPMTTDHEKCNEIMKAEQRTGRKLKIAFNCRYMPYMVQVKKLLLAGTIGEILSVDYNWYLDLNHGAQYFRRWHRQMKNSGGLLVHKSTHHFDLVNWWLADEPLDVSAFGALQFFGPQRETRGERCMTCDYQTTCPFFFDITKSEFNKSYFYDTEQVDGYIRDRCVFGEDIDIYDTMSVQVRYQRGALLNYSLVGHSPYKNWTATFNGTHGRIEAGEYYTGPRADETWQEIRIYNLSGEMITHKFKKATGSHGGSDDRIRKMFVNHDAGIDRELGQEASSRAGAMSMLIGAAANLSIKEERKVTIQELIDWNAE